MMDKLFALFALLDNNEYVFVRYFWCSEHAYLHGEAPNCGYDEFKGRVIDYKIQEHLLPYKVELSDDEAMSNLPDNYIILYDDGL